MKTNILFMAALSFTVASQGQERSGKILFEEKIKIEIKLEGDASAFASSLPKEQVSKKVLLFNPDYSLYEADKSESNENIMTQSSGSVTIKMTGAGADNKLFCNLKDQKKIEQKEFMTRMFLIEDEIKKAGWKISGNFREISGFNCQEAVWDDNGKKVLAWFAPSIPVSTGPAGYGGLPGLIIMVDINDGERTIRATSIDLSEIDVRLLVKPKDGKKVSPDEFKKIVEEKMKEMGGESGGGSGQIVIKIQG